MTEEEPIRASRGLRGLWGRLRHAERAGAARRQVARRLYQAAVGHARAPLWYRELGVPDTPEGRFEMIALHVALLLRRLRREGALGRALGQQLFDAMFVDLDGSLRELGVSDLSVGRYIKRLAGNLYARMDALDRGLAAQENDLERAGALEPMLRANVYQGAAPHDAQVAELARRLAQQDRALAGQGRAPLCSGTVVWLALKPACVADAGAFGQDEDAVK
jgi:cytochrome b pre-mRNA-processing protein 3